MNRIRTFVLAIVVSALMGAGALAQVTTPPATEPGGTVMPGQTPAQAQTTQAQMNPTQTSTTAPRNDGIGWGWIGLLGLAGLAGLTRRNARPVDRDATYPSTRTDATTTPRGVAH